MWVKQVLKRECVVVNDVYTWAPKYGIQMNVELHKMVWSDKCFLYQSFNKINQYLWNC